MQDDLHIAQQSGIPTTNAPTQDVAAKSAAKFRNTENPTETWAGRGKRPKWLKAQLAAGRQLDEFRIKE